MSEPGPLSAEEEAMTWDTFRLEFDEDGTLHIRGREGWREAICGECGEPIRWVLDMASFSSLRKGSYVLCHARCLWTREAFEDLRAALLAEQQKNERFARIANDRRYSDEFLGSVVRAALAESPRATEQEAPPVFTADEWARIDALADSALAESPRATGQETT